MSALINHLNSVKFKHFLNKSVCKSRNYERSLTIQVLILNSYFLLYVETLIKPENCEI